MNGLRYQRYAKLLKILLVFINVLAVLFTVSVYLFATRYIVERGLSHQLLEKLEVIPNSPATVYWYSLISFGLLLVIINWRHRLLASKTEYKDWLAVAEIILLITSISAMQFSYNGLILLVFSDIFYSYTDFYTMKSQRYWTAFIVISFSVLLISNFDLLSILIPLPSINTYISFIPSQYQFMLLFIKNGLTTINMVVFILSLVMFIMYSVSENHKIEEELRMADRANNHLEDYIALAEKMAEDRERKRIAREIHDTLGHALTGISAGIDAVLVLLDLDKEHAKKQLLSVSNVVRDGIQDVRRSLEKLRPGALERVGLEEALLKMIADYGNLSKMLISLDYHWENVDLDTAKEDLVFRLIQESVTNSLRHGHADHVEIGMYSQDKDYIITINDDGIGCKEIVYGYGLKQMQERLAVIGGRVQFDSANGFQTTVFIPKRKGEEI
ncbi:sensor histidine kinase [Streptococcus hillyeri]|uniref:histidine kinase n=1 Tax=Streptococcus hillyeri TaxID=2282420 RepID=A0A3L9DTF9_9STRE|nr:sensor histidine kinase [Streptococcus hillyeri]RLY02030.1 sensor histidine kinase [Streptococcus hillyeri]